MRVFIVLVALAGLAALARGLEQQLNPADFLPEMNQPVKPINIIGNIYYVGTNGVSSFLIVTPQGHILIDSAFNQSVPLIRQSVKTLGFRFEDIEIVLSSHAHFDHVAGHALVKEQTGARVMASALDADVIRKGNEQLWDGWKGTRVDRIIRDGDVVRLGDVALTAHLTPGHTPGCTTWTMNVTDGGRQYVVVFVGGYGINPGVTLVDNASYPTIADDYARTFRVLRSLRPDVFLAQHPEIFSFDEKVKRRTTNGNANPFIDPDGYRRVIQEGEHAYVSQLARERRDRGREADREKR